MWPMDLLLLSCASRLSGPWGLWFFIAVVFYCRECDDYRDEEEFSEYHQDQLEQEEERRQRNTLIAKEFQKRKVSYIHQRNTIIAKEFQKRKVSIRTYNGKTAYIHQWNAFIPKAKLFIPALLYPVMKTTH